MDLPPFWMVGPKMIFRCGWPLAGRRYGIWLVAQPRVSGGCVSSGIKSCACMGTMYAIDIKMNTLADVSQRWRVRRRWPGNNNSKLADMVRLREECRGCARMA